ncbi:hypothetical protein CHS0354_021009 [Potamilus streckersoni]|uniref:CCHC-type domain-containing protein n=1 Tax=Potamilus streckersoni TaxID=2493646 RepID=A0AAE0RUH1_9BIVA|nr:hypothetical protein CHS0354_021009 [Potamilus streckersoni]
MPVPYAMDPTVSSGTTNPTVAMSLLHFPYPPSISCIGLQDAPLVLAYSQFLHVFCLPSPPSETPDTLMQSAPSSVTSTSVTPNQSPSANQPMCSTSECTGHPHTLPISNPCRCAKEAIRPAQFYLYPDISHTSNECISTHMHNGAEQSVHSIAQSIPTGVPRVDGDNQLLNSQHNANDDAERRPKKISCYNCGSSKHLGPECTKPTMDEMINALHMIHRIIEVDSDSDSE